MHKRHALLALRAGKAVLCEKPVASFLSEGEAMLSECEKANTILAFNHQRRYDERWLRIRDALAGDDGIGQIISAHLQWPSGRFG